jgi:NADPH:quinone reductase-like Zn-dependent oxidoreductase
MKAVLLTGFGGPEKLDYREDVPVPEPQAGEVLVEVAAAGINNTDIWTREGAYGQEDDAGAVGGWRREPFVFPRIQGGDIAGHIVVVGQAVPASRIGERVLVDPALYADTGDGLVDASLIGSERDGGFAEYVAIPAANARTIHTTLSDAELATFPIAYITAERMLNRARVAAGETVFITGASGGVGSALLQLARARGARTVALVGPGKEEQAHSIGAEAVIIRGSGELAAAVGSAPGGRSTSSPIWSAARCSRNS